MRKSDYNKPSNRKFILIIFGLSVILRMIYLWQYHGTEYWGNLTVDANFHLQWAQSIANGNFWGNEVFFRAPFYPYLLALFHLLTSGNLLGIIILQNIIGLASFLLVYKLADNVCGRIPARISAIIYLLSFDFIFFESELLLDFLLVFFLPLIFLNIFKADKSGRKIFWLISGILLGLSAATRPTTLILLAIVPLFFLRYRSKLFSPRNWLISMLLFAAGTFAILLPIGFRNAVVGGEFSLIPSQGGINFYIGNNPTASGWSAAMPEPLGAFWQYADCRQIAENETGKILKPSQVSNYWLKKGLSFWSSTPGRALGLTVRKAGLLVSSKDLSNNRNLAQFKKRVPVSHIFIVKWWLLIPFGILGIIVSLRKDFKARLLFIFMLVYSLVLILFFITSRFRLPLMPFWIIFAGQGIYYAYHMFKSRDVKKLILIGLLFIAGFFISFHDFYKIDFSNPQQELYTQGNRLLSSGNYDLAIRSYRELLQRNPNFPQAAMNIGAAYVRLGQLDSAKIYYLQELRVNPDSALTLSSLAEIYRLQGNSTTAYQFAKSALQAKPYFTEILINYCKAARAEQSQAEAVDMLARYAKDYSSNPYFYFYRGILYLDRASVEQKYLDSARLDFENTLNYLTKANQPTYERDPEIYARLFSDAKVAELTGLTYTNLANVKFNLGDYVQAREAFGKALEYKPGYTPARRGLLETFMRLGEYQNALDLTENILPQASPVDSQTYLLYQAQAYYNLNKTGRALEVLQFIIEHYPQNSAAQSILEAIKKGG